ncbi:hypothetical protein Bca101_043911 [Brassica carinata]
MSEGLGLLSATGAFGLWYAFFTPFIILLVLIVKLHHLVERVRSDKKPQLVQLLHESFCFLNQSTFNITTKERKVSCFQRNRTSKLLEIFLSLFQAMGFDDQFKLKGSVVGAKVNVFSTSNLEVFSLSKLSSNLEQLLSNPDCDYTDAEIIVDGVPVGVHRCILSARSKFFQELFKKDKKSSNIEKPKYHLKEVLPYGAVGYEAFFFYFLSYIYIGGLKPSPLEVSTCVDSVCAHDSCRPAIDFVVELMYASSILQVPELVSSFQHGLADSTKNGTSGVMSLNKAWKLERVLGECSLEDTRLVGK